jgi:hypothetical protein
MIARRYDEAISATSIVIARRDSLSRHFGNEAISYIDCVSLRPLIVIEFASDFNPKMYPILRHLQASQ